MSGRVAHPGERRWETNLLATVTLILTAFGIINCYAAGTYLAGWYDEASQQALAGVIGGILFLVVARIDYTHWRHLARPLFLATLVGLGVLAIAAVIWSEPTGRDSFLQRHLPQLNGARRWIRLFGIQIQVSEVARLALALFLATRLADLGQRVRDLREGFVPVMGTTMLVSLLVAIEPSLSMAIVLGLVGAGVVFAAGARVVHFLPLVVVAVVGIWAVMTFEPVRAQRYTTFLTPALECDPLKDQACQSVIGIGNGGLLGVGFGQGTQKMGHLPYGYSDFLLSVIAEEWGLLGILFVVTLFTIYCWLGLRIARTARDPFGTYLATGLTLAVGVTALLHAFVVLRMMPPTGLTLPFMSAGRVSLIFYLVSAGMLMAIGRARGKPSKTR